MNIRDMIGELYPDLKEQMESEQYRLAQVLLTHRMKLNIDQDEMAARLGIQLDSYLKLEYADMSVPVETYQLALDAISLPDTCTSKATSEVSIETRPINI